MIKYMTLMAMSLCGFHDVVFSQDATFYSLHPVALQKALEKCPAAHPEGVSCEALDACATRANRLVSELHYSPQAFGQKILSLQEDMAKIESKLKLHPTHESLQSSLSESQFLLRERLAIVKWLESPRG